MRFLKNVLLGMAIAIAAILPGLSGGTLAAAIGLYEPIIRAISSLFREFRKNVLFLFPLALGGSIGVMAFSTVMDRLMQQYPNQIKLLFLGLVFGSMPVIIRQANAKGFRPYYLLAALAAMIVVYKGGDLIQLGPQPSADGYNTWYHAYCGFITAAGTILPGISASFILLHLGVYDDLLRAVATLDLLVLMPVSAGFGAGALILVRLAEVLFCRFYSLAYYAIFGFLLGSALLIVPDFQAGWMLLADAALFLTGAALSLLLLRLRKSSL